ncbi:MAG: hypothetical protein IID00_01555 [Chloroflexi bacterium]|nr:hypothetical protein [Chloroflexota bacterium]
MTTGKTPAFYALEGTTAWKDYVNLLHIPYTLWHLSYVVLGAAIAPTVHVDRMIGTLVAFFLAVGIASHSLDELNGRPLRTRIPQGVLMGMAAVSLAGAMGLGVLAGLSETLWIFPFVAFGGFIVVFYNLGIWHDRFHSDFWFAFSWGAFPVLTSYWINASRLDAAAVLLAFGCLIFTLAQRTLSTQVRTVRRKAVRVEGTMELSDGSAVRLDIPALIAVPERALLLLSGAIVTFAASLLAFRLLNH